MQLKLLLFYGDKLKVLSKMRAYLLEGKLSHETFTINENLRMVIDIFSFFFLLNFNIKNLYNLW